MSTIAPLSPPPYPLLDERLWLLQQIYDLDGQVTGHAPDATGFAPNNCYLLREGNHALLLDTGHGVHRQTVVAQLLTALGDSDTVELTVLATRISEFASLSNLRAVVERFRVRRAVAFGFDPELWFDFDPQDTAYGKPPRQGVLQGLDTGSLSGATTLEVDPDGRRRLEVLAAPLQLLPTRWLYDPASRTLFTVDTFTHVERCDRSGPWTSEDPADADDLEAIWHHMTRGRYWWLPAADTTGVVEKLDRLFDEYQVDVLAPAFGCPIVGAEQVARHVSRLRDVLVRAGTASSVGVAAGRWTR